MKLRLILLSLIFIVPSSVLWISVAKGLPQPVKNADDDTADLIFLEEDGASQQSKHEATPKPGLMLQYTGPTSINGPAGFQLTARADLTSVMIMVTDGSTVLDRRFLSNWNTGEIQRFEVNVQPSRYDRTLSIEVTAGPESYRRGRVFAVRVPGLEGAEPNPRVIHGRDGRNRDVMIQRGVGTVVSPAEPPSN